LSCSFSKQAITGKTFRDIKATAALSVRNPLEKRADNVLI
jgi:hypothetical protein